MGNNNLAGLVALGLGLLAGMPGAAKAAYSPMYRGSGYYYRNYTYYSKAYRQNRYHMAVYHPAKPRYVYYYNPYKGRYWGRYDRMTGKYSLLPVALRRRQLSEIPESAFPPGGAMPPAEPGDETPMPPPPEPGLAAPGGAGLGSGLPAAPGGGGCKKGY